MGSKVNVMACLNVLINLTTISLIIGIRFIIPVMLIVLPQHPPAYDCKEIPADYCPYFHYRTLL